MDTSKGIYMKVSREDKKKIRILTATLDCSITKWILEHLNDDYEKYVSKTGEVKK